MHKSIRLQWAKEFLNKPEEFWKNILFSDETRISIFRPDRTPMVRRRLNTSLYEKYLIPTVKYPAGIMIWGCFGYNRLVKLKMIENTLDSKGYKDFLGNEVQESGKILFEKDFIFQDDNAPRHRSATIKIYCRKSFIQDYLVALTVPRLESNREYVVLFEEKGCKI